MTKDELAAFLFAHPEDEEWIYSGDASLPVPATEILPLIAKVLRDFPSMAVAFSERQLCMGLRYLIDPGCSDVCFAIIHGPSSIEVRVDAIRAMVAVFEGLFTPDRVHAAAFNDLPDVERFSFDETCYMWWDLFPRHGVPPSPELRPVDLAILEDLREILALESFACKRSALRGLGLWAAAYPSEVVSIIDGATHIPSELTTLARDARAGRVR